MMQEEADDQNDPHDENKYYILDSITGVVVQLRPENVCRDYQYVRASLDIEEIHELMDAGWLNSFELSAVLGKHKVRSRALVVITDCGFRYGRKTNFHWCMRLNFRSDQVMPNWQHSYPNKFGSCFLWLLPPLHANRIFDQWKLDPTLANSGLIRVYEPSLETFDWKTFPDINLVSCVDSFANATIQHLNAASFSSELRRSTPQRLVPCLSIPDSRDMPIQPPFQSEIVSHKLCSRAQRLFPVVKKLTWIGWNVLCTDLTEFIFGLLARESIDMPGRQGSPSFELWKTLRLVCKDSKRIVETHTFDLMRSAYDAMNLSMTPICFSQTSNRSPLFCVKRAAAVQSILVPRGILPVEFYAQISHHKIMQHNESEMYTCIFPYLRLRLRIPNSIPPPQPIPCSMPKAVRSSSRLQRKRKEEEREGTKSGEEQSDLQVHYGRISIRMRDEDQNETPEHVDSNAAVMDTWVQCDHCDEWRMLPPVNSHLVKDGLYDSLSMSNLPDYWTCSMHPLGLYSCTGSTRKRGRRTRQKAVR